MSDIAARAAVSQTTVSFVLNGRPDRASVSEATRDRVLAVAREMGYQRNQVARSMVTGKSRILGVLVSKLRTENHVRILGGAQQAASERDYLLKIQHFSQPVLCEAEITTCLEWRLAGAMNFGLDVHLQDELYSKLGAWQINQVTVDNIRQSSRALQIGSDDKAGMRSAIEHLVGLGHSRIAFMGGRINFLSLEREQVFREALTEFGLRIEETWVGHSSWGDPVLIEPAAVNTLRSAAGMPTAVVCASDAIAMILCRVARSHGLHLPEDLSVTGFSNTGGSLYSDPPLTTVEQPFHEMGYAAAMHLIDKAEASEFAGPFAEPLRLPTRLIMRGSTAPPRNYN